MGWDGVNDGAQPNRIETNHNGIRSFFHHILMHSKRPIYNSLYVVSNPIIIIKCIPVFNRWITMVRNEEINKNYLLHSVHQIYSYSYRNLQPLDILENNTTLIYMYYILIESHHRVYGSPRNSHINVCFFSLPTCLHLHSSFPLKYHTDFSDCRRTNAVVQIVYARYVELGVIDREIVDHRVRLFELQLVDILCNIP